MEIYDYADLGGKHSWDYTMNNKSPKDDGIDPICTTEKVISMGELLIINNKAYSICSLSGKGNIFNTAYVEEIKDSTVIIDGEEPEEQFGTDEITCPFCKGELESFEMQDEAENYECPNCHSIFSYQREVEVTYSSQPVKQCEPMVID